MSHEKEISEIGGSQDALTLTRRRRGTQRRRRARRSTLTRRRKEKYGKKDKEEEKKMMLRESPELVTGSGAPAGRCFTRTITSSPRT